MGAKRPKSLVCLDCSVIIQIYIYKVVISVCFLVCMSDHISGNHATDLPQILIWELCRTTKMLLVWFEMSKINRFTLIKKLCFQAKKGS